MASKAVMSASWREGDADVVEALEEAARGWSRRAGTSTSMPMAGAETVRRSTSTVISSVGSASTAAQQLRRRPRPATCTGTRPFLVQLLRKMSAKRGEIDGLEAVVHERPHRVLARRAGAEVGAGHEDRRRPSYCGVVEHEARVVAPLARTGPAPKPVRSTRLSQSLGMIWSVSTSERSSGTAVPVTMRDGFHGGPPQSRSAGAAKWPAMAVAAATAGETRWVRPPRPWRPSKLRFDGGRAPLAGGELVGVHGQAHRAARLPPVEAGGGEDLVEALGLGLVLHRERAGHDHGPHAGLDRAALGHRGGGPQVLDAAVGARADEHGVDRDVAHRRAGGEAHVLEGPGGGVALRRGRRTTSGSGTAPSSGDRPGRGWCPRRRAGASAAASSTTSLSKAAPSSVGSVRQSSSGLLPRRRPSGRSWRPSR